MCMCGANLDPIYGWCQAQPSPGWMRLSPVNPQTCECGPLIVTLSVGWFVVQHHIVIADEYSFLLKPEETLNSSL